MHFDAENSGLNSKGGLNVGWSYSGNLLNLLLATGYP